MVYVRALTYTDLHVIKRSGNYNEPDCCHRITCNFNYSHLTIGWQGQGAHVWSLFLLSSDKGAWILSKF